MYYLEIEPVIPADQSGEDSQEGQNQFGLRVGTGGGFTPCAVATGEPGYSATCPVNVYGLTHMGNYAGFTGANPVFYLADVGPEHSGKIMEVELFDPAEGADTIELIPPTGADPSTAPAATVTWEVACMDGSYRSDNGGACASTTGENPPVGGYGPFTGSTIDVSGTVTDANRAWGSADNSQNGRYSDRLIRLRLTLPNNITSTYGGRTWWRIRYSVSDSGTVGDRTTWSVSILGDPVRLVSDA